MYYGHLNDSDLNFLHGKTLVTKTFKYADMVSNNLFKIFEHGDFVEINPLFYYDSVEVSDKEAVIRQNNIIIKKNNNTEFVFTSAQNIHDVQLFTRQVNDNYYMVYILNEWCDGLHNIPVRVTTSECETIPEVSLETTTILTDDYLGDFQTYYTEPITTTDYTTNIGGLILHITNEAPIYVEITINDKKYCFKTGGTL